MDRANKLRKTKRYGKEYRKGENCFGNKGNKERNAKELIEFPMDKHMKETGEVIKKYKEMLKLKDTGQEEKLGRHTEKEEREKLRKKDVRINHSVLTPPPSLPPPPPVAATEKQPNHIKYCTYMSGSALVSMLAPPISEMLN
jgi:hypothetical protein